MRVPGILNLYTVFFALQLFRNAVMGLMMKSNLHLILVDETQQRESHYCGWNELETKTFGQTQIIVCFIVWIIGF